MAGEQQQDPLIGRVLGDKYRVESLLGEGGFGAVYRARQLSVDRLVAVKVLKLPGRADPQEHTLRVNRFHLEARATSALKHPNTVTLLDFGDGGDDLLYMVLELLEGESLKDLIQREAPLSSRRTATIAMQLCRSLSDAHAKGILHRDLKPANIAMCDYSSLGDFAKILDFGIARILADTQDVTALTGRDRPGTPLYMAPEQFEGGDMGAYTDLYALGCILYEMLSGDPPYVRPSRVSTGYAHVHAPIPELRSEALNPDEQEKWNLLLLRLMAKRGQARPGRAETVLGFLAQLAGPEAQGFDEPYLARPEEISEQDPFIWEGETRSDVASGDSTETGLLGDAHVDIVGDVDGDGFVDLVLGSGEPSLSESAPSDDTEEGAGDWVSELGRSAARLQTTAGDDRDEIFRTLADLAEQICSAVRTHPGDVHLVEGAAFAWRTAIQRILDTDTSSETVTFLSTLERRVEACLPPGDSERTQPSGFLPPWLVTRRAWNEETGLRKLSKGNPLEKSDAVEWLVGGDRARLEALLQTSREEGDIAEALETLWSHWARLRMAHGDVVPTLADIFREVDEERWSGPLAALDWFFSSEFSPEEAPRKLAKMASPDREVVGECLLLHPHYRMRRLGFETVSRLSLWETLIYPETHMVILRELLTHICSEVTDSQYMKALFLLLRGRLMAVSSPLEIAETYEILKVLYTVPVFLETTFFRLLMELHKRMVSRVEQDPHLAYLEINCRESFVSFRSKEKLRDVDVNHLRQVPPPFQRKLAHEGHFPTAFVCSTWDAIALESVPHIMRRDDACRFMRLKRINGKALAALGENTRLMRNTQNHLAFCRNPKALAHMLAKELPRLSLTSLRHMASDPTVNDFARRRAAALLEKRNR